MMELVRLCMKRVVYGLGICTAIGYAYVRGYAAGLSQDALVDDVATEDEATGDEIDYDTMDSEPSQTESDDFECDDNNCSETFDTEHGKNVHMGIAHKDESDE